MPKPRSGAFTRRPRRPAGARRANPDYTPRPAAPPAPPLAEEVRAPEGVASFAELGVPAPVVESLARSGCSVPFPIQAATLPSSLAGRDVLGRGQTGSGKTIAFAVPVVAALAARDTVRRPGRPRGLVLVPTRELASQVAGVLTPLALAMGLRVSTVYGGVSQVPQVAALRRGIDVLVACPGRLEDLIAQGHCHLEDVEVCVLDEADHLADLGFLPAVRRILDQTPSDGQRMLFSATLDRAVDDVVRRYLTNPVTHAVDPVDAAPELSEHHLFTVHAADKPTVVRELASGLGRTLLFTRTKHAARRLASDLTSAGIPAADLHGNLSQAQRHRNLAAFSGGSVRVLVATDVAARGIHVDDVALVVHVDAPAEEKAYLHRSGRTARAGASGKVVTIASPDESRGVARLMGRAGVSPAMARVVPGHEATASVAGPPADPEFRRMSSPPPSATRTGGPPGSRTGGRPGGRNGARAGGRPAGPAAARTGGRPGQQAAGGARLQRSGGPSDGRRSTPTRRAGARAS